MPILDGKRSASDADDDESAPSKKSYSENAPELKSATTITPPESRTVPAKYMHHLLK